MMLFMASVMTIGEMRNFTMPKPFRKPVTNPTLIAAAAAGATLASCPSQKPVKTTAEAVSTQAIDKSMPPVSMTMVWPMAARPRNEASFAS